MIREVDIRDISDGRRYRSSDLVKADTLGCAGCSRCCRETQGTVRMNPMDLYALQQGTGKSFAMLLQEEYLVLQVESGLVFPYLNMQGGGCHFLGSTGRCTVHGYRPDFCRLFPLGRIYEEGSFSYFVQIHECDRIAAKVKVRKWLGIEDLPRYEAYIQTWHDFTMDAVSVLEGIRSEAIRQKVCTRILELFFAAPWDTESSFYEQFARRMEEGKHLIGRA